MTVADKAVLRRQDLNEAARIASLFPEGLVARLLNDREAWIERAYGAIGDSHIQEALMRGSDGS